MAIPAMARAPIPAASLLAAPVYLATPAGTVLVPQAPHPEEEAAGVVLLLLEDPEDQAPHVPVEEAAGVDGLAVQVDG